MNSKPKRRKEKLFSMREIAAAWDAAFPKNFTLQIARKWEENDGFISSFKRALKQARARKKGKK